MRRGGGPGRGAGGDGQCQGDHKRSARLHWVLKCLSGSQAVASECPGVAVLANTQVGADRQPVNRAIIVSGPGVMISMQCKTRAQRGGRS